MKPSCHSERSEDELLRTLSEKSEYINSAFQILRDAQEDNMVREYGTHSKGNTTHLRKKQKREGEIKKRLHVCPNSSATLPPLFFNNLKCFFNF